MSRRTPFQQIIQIIFVTVALVIVLVTKDQCGRSVGNLFDALGGGSSGSAGRGGGVTSPPQPPHSNDPPVQQRR